MSFDEYYDAILYQNQKQNEEYRKALKDILRFADEAYNVYEAKEKGECSPGFGDRVIEERLARISDIIKALDIS